jgi:hypothetical protein
MSSTVDGAMRGKHRAVRGSMKKVVVLGLRADPAGMAALSQR